MFVAPASDVRSEPVVVAAAPAVAVCGPDAAPLACAMALLLRRRGPGVVCHWGAGGRRASSPPNVRCRRLAASMAARGLTAHATGRLVMIALDEEPTVAAAEAARAAAAAGDAPVVLALCAPRDAAFDELLAAQDGAVVAAGDAPDELVRLAVAALADSSRRAVAAPSLTGVASWAACAGLWATPAARRSLAAAREGLG
jgi:hypothetical protein